MLDARLWFYGWTGGRAADIKMQCCILFRRKVLRLRRGTTVTFRCKSVGFSMVRQLRLREFMKFWANHSSGLDRHATANRHEFVIGPLCKHAVFQEKARLYYCIRCKWSFLVCGGKVVVLGEDGSPLGGDRGFRRFATFEEGPCPVLEAFVSAASFDAGPSQPQFKREDDIEMGHLVPRYLHPRSGRRRPVLHALS